MKLRFIGKKEIDGGVYEISFDISNQNFSFKAGQYIRMVLPRLDFEDTKGPARLFSIASSPNDKEKLAIAFRVSESGFKKTLINMPIGSEIEFEGPWGSFVLPQNTGKPVVFVAGGTGITPFVSMISFAVQENMPHRITLIYASQSKNSIAYLSELKALAKLNKRLKICFIVGLVDERMIRKNLPDGFDTSSFYISGPPEMIDYVRIILRKNKAAEKNVYYEEWSSLDFLKEPIKSMLDISTDGIFLTDLTGIIKYANPAWEKLSGWSQEEVAGKHTPRIQKSGKQDLEYYQNVWNYHLNGKVYRHDVINKGKNGNLYEVDHLYLPLFSEAKQIIGFAAFQRDVSEEKNRRYQQDQAILASIGDALVVVDQDGKILLANKNFEELIGLNRLVGRQYSEVWQMRDNSRILPLEQRPIEIALIQKKKVSTNAYSYVNSRGEDVQVAIIVSPMLVNGKIVGAVAAIRDITESKRIEKMKTEFVSIASHQLKTPLTAIGWITERLLGGKAGKFSEKQKDYLETIHNSNARMVKLVDDLLSVSRLEEGSVKIEIKPLQLEELIEEIIKTNEFIMVKKRCRIIFDKPKDKLPQVLMDESLIRQIAGNLVINAVRYSKDGGDIKVKLEKRGENFLLTISDNGIGIPKDKQHRIFEKFFRADNAQKVHPDGTGLGLYIVKMIVEILGGKIWFESEENKGTAFYVELPIHVL